MRILKSEFFYEAHYFIFILPILLPPHLAGDFTFIPPNVLSAHISPAYLFCLALGSSAFYYTNHSNTSSNLLASQKLLIRGNARVVCGKTAAVKIAHTPVCVLVCFTDERNKSTLLKDSC